MAQIRYFVSLSHQQDNCEICTINDVENGATQFIYSTTYRSFQLSQLNYTRQTTVSTQPVSVHPNGSTIRLPYVDDVNQTTTTPPSYLLPADRPQ